MCRTGSGCRTGWWKCIITGGVVFDSIRSWTVAEPEATPRSWTCISCHLRYGVCGGRRKTGLLLNVELRPPPPPANCASLVLIHSWMPLTPEPPHSAATTVRTGDQRLDRRWVWSSAVDPGLLPTWIGAGHTSCHRYLVRGCFGRPHTTPPPLRCSLFNPACSNTLWL